MKVHEVKGIIANKHVSISIGELAVSANGVVVRCGADVVLATCVVKNRREGEFSGLSVHYIEKFSAANKIPDGFRRREVMSDSETLTSRSIDRALRAVVPKCFDDEIQVVIQVLSFEGNSSLEALAICAGSMAMCNAGITDKLVAAARVVGEKVNCQSISGEMNLLQAMSEDKIVMLEYNGPAEMPKRILRGSLSVCLSQIESMQERAYDAIKEMLHLQSKACVGAVFEVENEYLQVARDYLNKLMKELSFDSKIIELVLEEFVVKFAHEEQSKARMSMEEAIREFVAQEYLNSDSRLDLRKFDEMRKVFIRVNYLKNLHGSALFTRGMEDPTQALVAVTVGDADQAQIIKGINGIARDNVILHYNFMPYCVGEIGKIGALSRREIGHGELARKAILPIVDSSDKTIRIVSDIMASNGSSSMATVCGASLALFDSGVEISEHVAGVSIGIVEHEGKQKLLTDITQFEDAYCGMDFKIAGTKNAITAMQLDVKNDGISLKTCAKAIKQAVVAIKQLLQEMNNVISEPKIGQYAVTESMKVHVDKIRDVIGKNGLTVNALCEECKVRINVDKKSGKIIISGMKNAIENAKKKIVEIVKN